MKHSEGSFGHDLDFLQKHQDTILLQAADNPKAMVAVAPDYQGRVMTSTAGGKEGNSYGWINYELIASGALGPHMNAFGGEDRLWLSPEGGQFSLYFAPGSSFDFEHWQTPPVIDSEPFERLERNDEMASFSKRAALKNHSGTPFDIEIYRKVRILNHKDIQNTFTLANLANLEVVGYESTNALTNHGADWAPSTGAIGIWILGMFKPSATTTIIVPFDGNIQNGLTADYFGPIPSDRLVVAEKALFLRADGQYRSKIGLSPSLAHPIVGSYDRQQGLLTIVTYDLDKNGAYLKSTWEHHTHPYAGDVLNAYNDGPLEDGSQMGPFYELESSSAAHFLNKGERLSHRHRTYHFSGAHALLEPIAQRYLQVSLSSLPF
ncbi:hypothetical protein CLV98_101511 [Dyadobacter jejuensis]|uniref:Methane monooxygenase PmoA-like n=1 Tax=Dyadobacter jejuensis TaxID=1082580 RepID=A0A316AUG3_9BACT|nr:DUF6786 family protein [Dyadobacter jejuensis]PWJ60330.1 hypothetical protein CLV98_101511 [Dyadobacter jejuensis]